MLYEIVSISSFSKSMRRLGGEIRGKLGRVVFLRVTGIYISA